MTLHPKDQWLIPAETVKVARAAFPKGNVYMKMRDTLGQLYYDHDFTSLFRADCGKVALSPGQLALITVMQFAEGLTDRQAARTRQTTDEFKQRYATRAGVEGTVSQAVRSLNLRRSCYIGLAKTHLQHVATAAAMNLSRFLAWLEAVPKATTRTSAFAAIASTA